MDAHNQLIFDNYVLFDKNNIENQDQNKTNKNDPFKSKILAESGNGNKKTGSKLKINKMT